MKWIKYFTAFLCGVIVSSGFTMYIVTVFAQENKEIWVQHHIHMLEEFDKGEISPSRYILLESVSIVAQDLEKMIESEPFGDCSDRAKSILQKAHKYTNEVNVCN
jgi:hypothetical protein